MQFIKRLSFYVCCALLSGACLDRELKPITPCLVSAVSRKVEAKSIEKIDLLFVVDNSRSMAGEQASLRREFPRVINVLTTGERFPGDPDAFPPIKNLHVGVVSTDMGIPGVNFNNCSADGGDDGKLLNAPHGDQCLELYPSFLTHVQSVEQGVMSDVSAFANDVGCIATLGTEGCGFEQQLEAPLKALMPRVQTDQAGNVLADQIRFRATAEDRTWGRGDVPLVQGGNLGFLRNDPNEGLSLIAVVVVTDEEDCSVNNTEHLTPDNQLPADSPYRGEDINLRCFKHKQFLYDVEQRYYHGLRRLRPGNEDLVVFAAIAGVPPDLVAPDVLAQVDFKDPAQSNAFYDRILGDSRMQEVVDPSSLGSGNGELTPSCVRAAVGEAEDTVAFPPRRIVELAKLFGQNGIVQSICQDDFGPAMTAIVNMIASRIVKSCLPRPLVRQQDGEVQCNVVWELPPPGFASTETPTQCSQRTYLGAVDEGRATMNERGGFNCKVKQLPVLDLQSRTEPAGDGWYYDDFSEDLAKLCAAHEPQRVAFTQGARPPNGVMVKLECLNETQRVEEVRTDVAAFANVPTIGSACGGEVGSSAPSGDAACVVALNDGRVDGSLFCHVELNVCMRACSTADECPAAWVCDDRPQALAETGGKAYCVNPVCGQSAGE
jgi:hypothetical protein